MGNAFICGSLIALGDALQRDDYFDRAPVLEMVYHLRNGVAHGNRFNFTRHGLTRLATHSADFGGVLTIAPEPQGQQVMGTFLKQHDHFQLLGSVVFHLASLNPASDNYVGES